MIEVKILADSVNPVGVRLTSWLLTYPRFIHAELMTHRVFSRNAASSRAVPISRMIAEVIRNPAVPEFWGANQKGMQALTELGGIRRGLARFLWKQSRWFGVAGAWLLSKVGAHKQIANRLLEPWAHITFLVTGVEHNNFFALRAHPDAQPEFQVVAYRMLHAYLHNEPQKLGWGQIHSPFGASVEKVSWKDIPLVAAGRAARLSYLTHDGKFSPEADKALAERLLHAGHMSPFEHIATADMNHTRSNLDAGMKLPSCWRQHRKDIRKENRTHVNLWDIFSGKPSWVTIPKTGGAK